MHDYGLHLGMAFQICDDALDYDADPAYLGKNGGDDFHEGKITLPVILAWAEADDAERVFWQRTLGDNNIQDGDLDRARSLLGRHNAIRALPTHEQKQNALLRLCLCCQRGL